MGEFALRYEVGPCPICGDELLRGDLVVYVDDVLVHVECEGAALTALERPGGVGGWLEKLCPPEDGQGPAA